MKKAMLSVFVIAVCLVLVVMPSAGWLTDLDEQSNQLQIADMTVEIAEQFTKPEDGLVQPGTSYEKIVRIHNATNAPVFVRVMAFPEMTRDNIVYEATAQMDINKEDWADGEDGFYYYKKALPPGETTSPLFQSVLIPIDGINTADQGAVFQMMIRSEACGITSDYGHITAWFGGAAPVDEPLRTIDQMLREIADGNGGGAK